MIVLNLKNLLIGVSLAAAMFTLTGFGDDVPKNYKTVTEVYEVRQGDTLWSISSKFMGKNTYGKRDIREFMSGITELNYDAVFKDRESGMIYPGDELKINYWVEDEKRTASAPTETVPKKN